MMSLGSFALYPMVFYELQPIYLCKDLVTIGEWATCETEEFCDKPEVVYKVDESNSLSLHNWVTDYDMTCSPKYQFGLFGSMYFFAVVLASITLTPLADRFGRKIMGLLGVGLIALF